MYIRFKDSNKRKVKRILFDNIDFFILFSIASVYLILLYNLSFLKYYTFHATFYDLGLNNEILWLLSHGFLPNYFHSQFNQIYPFQYEKPIVFVLLPIYFIYPHIETLLFLQTLFLGFTIFPIYYTGRVFLKSKPIALIAAISFLGFFPVVSANLFDFHFSSLFPFFYLTTVMWWALGKTKMMVLSSIVTSLINPLALILAIFFLIYTVLYDFRLKNIGNIIEFAKSKILVLTTILSLALLFTIYHLAGTLYFAGATPSANNSIFFYEINYKLELFLFLFGAIAFIPLFDLSTLFLIAPYAGYVILSTNSANFQIFGLHYPIFAAGPLYLGLILGLKTITHRSSRQPIDNMNLYEGFSKDLSKDEQRSVIKIVSALVVTVLVFTTVYFPYSPVNSYVQGGYFNGNHNINSLTNITPQVSSLHKVISLIPSNASLLTMNDIPEVSGREFVGLYDNHANMNYNYILFNSYFSYFTAPYAELPFLNDALDNNSYGILSETQSSLLLEKNYTGAPQYFQPYSDNVSANYLATDGNAVRIGNTIQDNYSNSFMWYGPYDTFFPGVYNFTFYLSSANISSNHSQAVIIEVSSGSFIFSSKIIYRNDFRENNTLVGFTITARFSSITPYVEFRGSLNSGEAKLSLHSVMVQQLSGSW